MKHITYKIQYYFDDGWIFARDGDHDIEIPLHMANSKMQEVAFHTGCRVRLIKIEIKETILRTYN